MKTEQELLVLSETASKEYDEAFNKLPPDLDYEGLVKAMKPFTTKVMSISRQYRMIKTPTFNSISKYGDHMILGDFIDICKCGGFIDSDGFGVYATKDKESDIYIRPSDIKHNSVRSDFSHVVWFNK